MMRSTLIRDDDIASVVAQMAVLGGKDGAWLGSPVLVQYLEDQHGAVWVLLWITALAYGPLGTLSLAGRLVELGMAVNCLLILAH